MIAVLFEAHPSTDGAAEYFRLAAELLPRVERIDGFVSIERFQSLACAGKILSLSFWRDEAAVQRWRELDAHRAAQARGRAGVFTDYRLRIAAVLRDYGLNDRVQAPPAVRGAGGTCPGPENEPKQ